MKSCLLFQSVNLLKGEPVLQPEVILLGLVCPFYVLRLAEPMDNRVDQDFLYVRRRVLCYPNDLFYFLRLSWNFFSGLFRPP